jgi:hypothetical protein
MLPAPFRERGSRLSAVTSSAADNVWAFGTAQGGGYALRWDGMRWTISHAWPTGERISGAVAVAPDDVWVFWEDVNQSEPMGTWHFDGNGWRQVQNSFRLTAGSAVTPTDIWAVGGQHQSDGTDRPLVARWDGNSWLEMPTPDIPYEWPYLPEFKAIHATSTDDVWVVGSRIERVDGQLLILPLALHWDGSAWQIGQVPGENGLTSVASDGRGGAWVSGTVGCTIRRYTNGEWTCPELPGIAEKVLDIHALTQSPGTSTYWGVGELVWGGLPNTDGVVLRYS